MGDETLCTCGHQFHWPATGYCHECGNEPGGCHKFTPAPSPARDDAEKAIAGLLLDELNRQKDSGVNGNVMVEPLGDGIILIDGGIDLPRLASVIAAHMAAPDELTALRSELATLRVRDEHYEILLADNLALRDRIDRVTALTGGSLSDGHRPYAAIIGTETQFVILLDDLRAALGDS